MAENPAIAAVERPQAVVPQEADFDHRNLDWFIDKLVQTLVFIARKDCIGIARILDLIRGTRNPHTSLRSRVSGGGNPGMF